MRLATLFLLLLAAPLAAPTAAAQPATWTLLGGPHHGALPLVVTPDGTAAYTAVADFGGSILYHSADGGATWTPSGYVPGAVLDIRLGAGGTLLVGTPTGIRRQWPGEGGNVLGLSHRVERVGEAGSVLYAWPGSPTNRRQIARSADGGATWETRLITDHGNENILDAHFAADGTAFVASVSYFSTWVTYKIFHSTDGGATWAVRSHDGSRFVESPDGSVFAVTPLTPEGGTIPRVARFTGGDWEVLAQGEFTGAAVAPDGTALPAAADGFAGGPAPGRLPRPTLVARTASGTWLAATERNGLFRWTEASGWRQVPLGHFADVGVLTERPDGVLVAGAGVALLEHDGAGWRTGAWVRGVPEGVLFDAGRTIVASGGRDYDGFVGSGLVNAGANEWLYEPPAGPITATAITRAGTALIATLGHGYAGDVAPWSGPVRSTDGGTTWEAGAGPWGMPADAPCDLRTLAVGPDGTVWAASRSRPEEIFCFSVERGLYRSTDAGATWTAAGAGFPGEEASAFAWRGGDTFAASPAGGVYRLGDGDVWTPFGLDGLPVHDLAVSVDGALLAATNTGIIAYDGVGWVGVGLNVGPWGHPVRVNRLHVSPGGDVYAATPRGVYRSDAPLVVSGDAAAAPLAFRLEGVYPNPARGAASVAFALPEAATARVTVYDLLGRTVLVAADGPLPTGAHAVPLAASGLPAGTYVVEVRAGDARAVARWTWLGR